MTYDPDDPRLTAYALGELDEAERSALEAHLEAHPEARQFVAEVRALAQLLTEHLPKETGPGLSPAQHRTIEARLRRPSPWKAVLGLASLAAAAAVILAVGGLFGLRARVPLPEGKTDALYQEPLARVETGRGWHSPEDRKGRVQFEAQVSSPPPSTPAATPA
ncbi:MAG: zf-HC2 domain-containing protein, partial [Isosphaeraceae bacterium]|nr:zf-HC2 domain-containing protein [Isosphaeraceae bacterium]